MLWSAPMPEKRMSGRGSAMSFCGHRGCGSCRCWGGGGHCDLAGLEVVDEGADGFGGDGVAFDAAGAGDVDADGFAIEVHDGATAVVGAEDHVVLEDLWEA